MRDFDIGRLAKLWGGTWGWGSNDDYRRSDSSKRVRSRKTRSSGSIGRFGFRNCRGFVVVIIIVGSDRKRGSSFIVVAVAVLAISGVLSFFVLLLYSWDESILVRANLDFPDSNKSNNKNNKRSSEWGTRAKHNI